MKSEKMLEKFYVLVLGKVENLFLIFLRHPSVCYALGFVTFCDNYAQEQRGTKADFFEKIIFDFQAPDATSAW